MVEASLYSLDGFSSPKYASYSFLSKAILGFIGGGVAMMIFSVGEWVLYRFLGRGN